MHKHIPVYARVWRGLVGGMIGQWLDLKIINANGVSLKSIVSKI